MPKYILGDEPRKEPIKVTLRKSGGGIEVMLTHNGLSQIVFELKEDGEAYKPSVSPGWAEKAGIILDGSDRIRS